MTGSIASSRLGLVIAEPMGPSTAFLKCYELRPVGRGDLTKKANAKRRSILVRLSVS
jgi:hypothetical protein